MSPIEWEFFGPDRDRDLEVITFEPDSEELATLLGSHAYEELEFRAHDAVRMANDEIESLRTDERTMHIDDVDVATRAQLAGELLDVVDALGVLVQEIWVSGSWARGDAIPMISDLDLRVVGPGVLSYRAHWALTHYLRVEIGPEICPEIFGYIDARPSTIPPEEGVLLV